MTEDEFRRLLLRGTREQLVSLAAKLERWTLDLQRHMARRWPQTGLAIHNAETDLGAMTDAERTAHMRRLTGHDLAGDDTPQK